MAHHVSFEAIETYLDKNVYLSDIMGDKDKKQFFKWLKIFFYASWRIKPGSHLRIRRRSKCSKHAHWTCSMKQVVKQAVRTCA